MKPVKITAEITLTPEMVLGKILVVMRTLSTKQLMIMETD
jgi:hypothetical protein